MEKGVQGLSRRVAAHVGTGCTLRLLDSNEVGSLYDYGDGMFTINMDNIIYCVLGDITREQYMEWQEYICDAAEFDFPMPNLRSWMHGCPRTSQETFERFRKLKADLNKAVEEEKERMKE